MMSSWLPISPLPVACLILINEFVGDEQQEGMGFTDPKTCKAFLSDFDLMKRDEGLYAASGDAQLSDLFKQQFESDSNTTGEAYFDITW